MGVMESLPTHCPDLKDRVFCKVAFAPRCTARGETETKYWGRLPLRAYGRHIRFAEVFYGVAVKLEEAAL